MVKKKPKKGEQGYLIDITPENMKQIRKVTTAYKAVQGERLALLQKEVVLKNKLLDLIHAADLQKDSKGAIKFGCDDWEIELKPTDEKLTVTPKKNVKGEEE